MRLAERRWFLMLAHPQVDALKEQLKRKPKKFPTLTIDPKVTSVESCTFADLKIEGYEHHPKIQMEMAV